MAGYSRQDIQNNISNGSVIDADDLDAEFNTLEAVFNSTTGHSHDGSAGEGAPITKVGPAQDLVVSTTALTPKATNTLDLGTNSIQFKNAWFDGTVDTDLLTVSSNASVGGTLVVTGAITAASGLVGVVTGTVTDISNHTTNDLTEGTNLYYTNGRARAALSVIDAGGDGSLGYNADTGVLTYTGPNDSEVRAHLSAGTGVSYSSGQFSIGQSVSTTSDVVFANVSVSGEFTGDVTGNLTGNVTGNLEGDVSGNVTGNVTGNLTGSVTGNSTTATTLATARTIALAGDVTGSASFNGSSNVTITATVADDSHNHTISNIDGLQTEIDTKAELAGSSGQNFSAATLNATTVDLGDWTLTESAGTLYFASGGVNKMKLDASGNLTVTGNVNTAGVI